MAWLSGWDQRVKLTIDNTDIDAALSNFPVLVYLSTSSGRNNDDVSFVFDELTNDANRKKIAVTTSDGTTECYVEIEKWDDANEQAWLWVKAPSISNSADTDLYLYYDKDHAENTTYVDDTNTGNSHNVWNSDFKAVHHLTGADAAALDDSTSQNNDVTASGGTPVYNSAGKIGKCVELDAGASEYLQIADADTLDGWDAFTIEFWVDGDNLGDIANGVYRFLLCKYATVDNQRAWSIFYYGDVAGDRTQLNTSADGTVVASSFHRMNLANGTWYHIVWRRTGADANPELIINNVSKALDQTETCGTLKASTAPLDMARCTYSAAGRYFDGHMDEVRLSGSYRSDAWVKATYETGRDELLDFGSEESAPSGLSIPVAMHHYRQMMNGGQG